MYFQKPQNYIAFRRDNSVISTTILNPDNLPVLISKVRKEITQEFQQINQAIINDERIVSNIKGAITEIETYTNFFILDQTRVSKYGNKDVAKYGYLCGTRFENIAGNVNNITSVIYKKELNKEHTILQLDVDYKIEIADEYLKRYNVILLKNLQCFHSSIGSIQIQYRCGFENNDFSQLPDDLQQLIIKITAKRISNPFRICNKLLAADIETLLKQYTISSQYLFQK